MRNVVERRSNGHRILLLFLWLFPSSGVAAMVVDRLFPVSPVSFIALSQSYSLHVPLAHILPPCLWSPSLPFPRYRFRHHSPHYVIFLHPHDVPIPFQSSLRYLHFSLLSVISVGHRIRHGNKQSQTKERPDSVIFFPINARAWAVLNCLIWWVRVND